MWNLHEYIFCLILGGGLGFPNLQVHDWVFSGFPDLFWVFSVFPRLHSISLLVFSGFQRVLVYVFPMTIRIAISVLANRLEGSV